MDLTVPACTESHRRLPTITCIPARSLQGLSLRPGGDEYALSVRNATTGAVAPAAMVVDRTYTYFGDVPDPVVLEVTVRRDTASRGGRKTLAVVYSSWLPD